MMIFILAWLLVFHFADAAFAYIDPGAGFPFFQGGPFIFGLLAAFLSVILFLLRRCFRFFRRNFIFLLIILLTGMGIWRWVMMNREITFPKKIIILGIDALDYELTAQFLEAGKLPNLSRLKSSGTFLPLATVCPPESVVAWTSFATGMNPGNHGIFDFIMRDPATYLPYLSLAEISLKPAKKAGAFSVPAFSSSVTNRRKAPAFWEVTSARGIPAQVYFCPNTFPPEKIRGKMLSGMGVPDIRGTMGTFSFYTTKKPEKTQDIGGRVFFLNKEPVMKTSLYGPRNTALSPARDIIVPMSIEADDGRVKINLQKNHVVLAPGQWSEWVRVRFPLGTARYAKGICRFYAKSAAPELELYCSPVNFDPAAPFFPVSYPAGFAGELARKSGLFYTQGMPYDTWALNDGRINRKIFLEQANAVLEEREKILRRELSAFRGGVFFFYFNFPDPIQHVFYANHSKKDAEFSDEVLKCYQRMDEIAGFVLDTMDKDAVLMVVSDHGIAPFHTAVNLNSWLRDNGFLKLKEGTDESNEFFESVDWGQTRAYALGFGGIYLNMSAREARGIVTPGEEADGIRREIAAGLSAWHDPRTGEPAVNKIYFKEDVFSGRHDYDAPDLFIGFNRGFRASWQTALGAVPREPLEENKRPWQADHIFDPELVPGVLFINRKLSGARAGIIDIIPTVYKLLGIEDGDCDGQPLL